MRTGTLRAAYGKVLELAIPIDALDCRNDERLEFFVTIKIAESFGERWPIYGTFSASSREGFRGEDVACLRRCNPGGNISSCSEYITYSLCS